MKSMLSCLFLMACGFSLAESVRLSGDNVAFAYESKLGYVKGGPLFDKNGKEFHPSNLQAYDGPILQRQNNNRPIRMEPGNK